jgi:beta-N-acetylhexosaminidase
MKIKFKVGISSKLFILALCLSPLLIACSEDQDGYQDLKREFHSKVKSMVMVGFRDSDLEHVLEQDKVGGYILFARDYLTKQPRNIYSYSRLCQIVDKLHSHGISMIASDMEGGLVNRFAKLGGFEMMPSPAKLATLDARSYKDDSVYGVTKFFISNVAKYGININFAPVVDVLVNQDPEFFLKSRAFSSDPDVVTQVGEMVVRAHRASGVMSALKHFPGHGSSKDNSHFGFVDITDTWKEIEFKPYERLIAKSYADMVMVAHVINRNWDSKYPATMSHSVVTGLLRKKLNYDGVVITDSIDMQALTDHFTLEDIVVNAVNAGVDIILHANQMQYDIDIGSKIYDIIMKALHDGKISKDRINEAQRRISAMNDRMQVSEKDALKGRVCSDNHNIINAAGVRWEKILNSLTVNSK